MSNMLTKAPIMSKITNVFNFSNSGCPEKDSSSFHFHHYFLEYTLTLKESKLRMCPTASHTTLATRP